MQRNRKFACQVFLVFAFILVSAFIIAKEAPDTATLDKIRDKMEPVVFGHKKHIEEIKVECAACHHENPKEPASCYACHKDKKDGDAVAAKKAFHNLCIDCHKEDENKKAPDKCMECHKKEPKP